jgi:hypothetical protein
MSSWAAKYSAYDGKHVIEVRLPNESPLVEDKIAVV